MEDNDEKSVQVANMQMRIKRCPGLGPSKIIAQNVSVLKEIACRIEVDLEREIITPPTLPASDLKIRSLFPTPANKRHERRAAKWGDMASGSDHPWTSAERHWVPALFQRSYFERPGSSKEIQLSRHAIFHCGPTVFEENVLWHSALCLCQKLGDMKDKSVWIRLHDIAYRRMSVSEDTYSSIRGLLREVECHDPRDYIYASLWLVDRTDRALDVRPDYSLDMRSVFMDVTRRKIQQQQALELLEACELSTACANIPSWVPDWSSRSACASIGLCATWSSSGFISTLAEIELNISQCTAGGLVTCDGHHRILHTQYHKWLRRSFIILSGRQFDRTIF